MESEYKVLGCNDDKDYCTCCGKQGLSKVVWMENLESGEVSHYGVVCAKKLTGKATDRAVAKFTADILAEEYSLEASAWENVDNSLSRIDQEIAVGKILHETGKVFTTMNAQNSIKKYLKSLV